jgi:hypothetical protein
MPTDFKATDVSSSVLLEFSLISRTESAARRIRLRCPPNVHEPSTVRANECKLRREYHGLMLVPTDAFSS